MAAASLTIGAVPVEAQGNTANITLYGGPVSSGASGTYGFGYSADNITSPGPTITLHDGEKVTVTFHNVDTSLPHSFAVTTGKSDSSTVLFNSETNPGTYVQPGQTATVTFTVSDNVGDYYYICKVPGHVDLGMWGNCVIEAAIPEFPMSIMLIFVLAAGAAVAISVARIKTKPKLV